MYCIMQRKKEKDELSWVIYLRVIFKTLFLSSLFEKLRDTRDKTLVCKNRKPKKIA
jgi:hypothetical protein